MERGKYGVHKLKTNFMMAKKLNKKKKFYRTEM